MDPSSTLHERIEPQMTFQNFWERCITSFDLPEHFWCFFFFVKKKTLDNLFKLPETFFMKILNYEAYFRSLENCSEPWRTT